jgi:hypothetical protein
VFVLRKLYILPEENGGTDDSLLDALAAAGLRVRHEGDLENPVCPVCGGATLLAYTEHGSFEVLTWSALDEGEASEADAWFLVCQNPECPWEEHVERVLHPMGATIFFDMESAHVVLDDEIGLVGGRTADLLELIGYLQGLLAEAPNRKLQCYLEEAEWHVADKLNEVRSWLERIPAGRRIFFFDNGERITARFVLATTEGMLILTQPGGAMVAVAVQALDLYGPDSFDGPEPDLEEAEPPLRHPEQWIMIHGHAEKVVVRGFHLRLTMTDRLGQYHAGTDDLTAAQALGLEPSGAGWWEGRFRRSDIEARYDEHRMLRVCGHWVEVYGESRGNRFPAVKTADPAIAAQLGLAADGLQAPAEPGFSGLIPPELIEAERVDRVYHWPAARTE